MTDLQLALLAIGAVVIVAVVAYNKWQEVQLRRASERAFASPPADALMAEPPRGTTAAAPAPAPAPPAAEERIEHTLDDDEPGLGPGLVEPEAAPSRAPPPHALDVAVLDPAVDYIVPLDCPHPIDAAALAAHAQALIDEGLIKPVHWEGYEAARDTWGPLNPGARYEHVRAGLQLTNRAGPVTEQELLAFCSALGEVALALAAQTEFPDPAEAADRARELDRFCVAVDVQIGLSVIGSESHTFSGSKIRGLAESAGLTLGRDGRYHRRAEDGSELFSLANLEPMPFHAETIRTLQTRGVTVLLDVPRVAASAAAFRRFIDFAHQLEHALGGVLVDDDRKPIGQVALEAIMRQLDHIHSTMAARSIPAGGPLALRLFS